MWAVSNVCVARQIFLCVTNKLARVRPVFASIFSLQWFRLQSTVAGGGRLQAEPLERRKLVRAHLVVRLVISPISTALFFKNLLTNFSRFPKPFEPRTFETHHHHVSCCLRRHVSFRCLVLFSVFVFFVFVVCRAKYSPKNRAQRKHDSKKKKVSGKTPAVSFGRLTASMRRVSLSPNVNLPTNVQNSRITRATRRVITQNNAHCLRSGKMITPPNAVSSEVVLVISDTDTNKALKVTELVSEPEPEPASPVPTAQSATCPWAPQRPRQHHLPLAAENDNVSRTLDFSQPDDIVPLPVQMEEPIPAEVPAPGCIIVDTPASSDDEDSFSDDEEDLAPRQQIVIGEDSSDEEEEEDIPLVMQEEQRTAKRSRSPSPAPAASYRCRAHASYTAPTLSRSPDYSVDASHCSASPVFTHASSASVSRSHSPDYIPISPSPAHVVPLEQQLRDVVSCKSFFYCFYHFSCTFLRFLAL